MEVKVNREIRNYTESIYFGLSLRQFLFSILGCGMSVLVYFLFKDMLGSETISWVCILSAFPFAILGFVKYNGMNAEEFVKSYIRSEFLIPKKLCFNPSNYYYELICNNKIKKDVKTGKKDKKIVNK